MFNLHSIKGNQDETSTQEALCLVTIKHTNYVSLMPLVFLVF
uniref:Uncharacterized protein n=1 Tax=Rhizophora mucronata TaxID=61149 RepID=A0A2P2NTU5_RHIMU